MSVLHPDLSETVFTVLCHISAALNGVSGIIFCATPPVISATWFPPGERVTATSIGQMLNGLGGGVSFLIARFMVPNSNNNGDTSELRQYMPDLNTLAVFPILPTTNVRFELKSGYFE